MKAFTLVVAVESAWAKYVGQLQDLVGSSAAADLALEFLMCCCSAVVGSG